jgi:hypothetical protein
MFPFTSWMAMTSKCDTISVMSASDRRSRLGPLAPPRRRYGAGGVAR